MTEIEIIPDNDNVYRRIPRVWYIETENRPSSAAFRDPETSVDWSKYSTPEESLKGYSGYFLASIKAKIPREMKLDVIHRPSKNNHSHSVILGQKTPSKAKSLADRSVIVKKP
ncbi:MAG: hypothetical protein KJ808_07345 [Acidobacteria bacterium]|nr:hypothetical protein [Acidobacteriota bacterium]MBU4307529.1 hypothetical protein [Acidobacteriota bacterium]MBU4405016.1 hypothetical protein [Acidobacteriota bacterium]MCG2810912.1 hypothetical protein [Candidatus Aminicenantes bacterium]